MRYPKPGLLCIALGRRLRGDFLINRMNPHPTMASPATATTTPSGTGVPPHIEKIDRLVRRMPRRMRPTQIPSAVTRFVILGLDASQCAIATSDHAAEGARPGCLGRQGLDLTNRGRP